MVNKSNKKIAFLIEYGSALHRCGTPSDQLEQVLMSLSDKWQLNGQIFSTPTYMMMSFTKDDDEYNHMERLEPKDYDLNRRQSLDELGIRLMDAEVTEQDALFEIKAIMRDASLYGSFTKMLGFGLLSSALAFLTDGSLINVGFAFILGFMVGIIEYLCMKANLKHLFVFIAAFIVGIFGHVFHIAFSAVDPRLIIIAGVIALVPGMTLTMAMSELANTHLASGTARLMNALITLLKILFGVVFASKIVTYFGHMDIEPRTVVYPFYVKFIPLILFGIGKSIILNIRPSEFKWVFVSCSCAYFLTQWGIKTLGPETGVFLGATVTCILANSWSLIFKKSALIFLIPGIFLLVPGSLAYKSISFFHQKNIISGINSGFKVFIISSAIVIGLLVGNTLFQSKRKF